MAEISFGPLTKTPLSLLEQVCLGGSDGDWQRFISIYRELVLKWLGEAGVAVGDREDVAQEVFAAIVRALPKFKHSGRPGAFRCWLRTVVRRRAISHFRRQRRQHRHIPLGAWVRRPISVADPQQDQWQREHDQHVMAQLMRLVKNEVSTSTWLAFYGQVVENRPAAEVAASLGITLNAALIGKSRVLKRLRQLAQGLVE